MGKGFRSADFWSGLVLAALGGYVVFQASHWEYLGTDGPGAGFFPVWYGIAMLVLAGGLAVSTCLKNFEAAPRLDWNAMRRPLMAWCALAVALASFTVVGFVAGYGLLTFFTVSVLYRRPLKSAALIAALSAAGFYLVFTVALSVQLPVGLLGF